jgi:hypothetical protein
MRKLIAITLSIMVFFAAGAGLSYAEGTGKPEKKKAAIAKSEVKEIQGEVSYITKRSISVVYARDAQTGSESEILLPYDKNLVIVHKRRLSEIQVGDIVSVKYLDEILDYGDKKENKITAKAISFLNPAPSDSPYKKAIVPETGEGESLLPLKGAKE